MKHARVNVSLIDAWEEWLVEVPEDADEDWIIENLEDISAGKGGEFLSLLDSGNYGFEDAEVMKIDDGNASASTFTITHNLNTTDVAVSVREVSSGDWVVVPWKPLTVATLDPIARNTMAPATEPDSYIDVVFDGPPGPVCGRFVECEDETGASINAGEWIDRGDGLWALRIPR